MPLRFRTLAALVPIGFAAACASQPASPAPSPSTSRAGPPVARRSGVGLEATRTALTMIGVPYRYGGSSPRGFDCSGLVVYSYAEAGLTGLPHSAAALERRARPVPLAALEPGDLLFFDLDGPKTHHVAIYLGDEAFVHAPSAGKRVERVDLDHVYWGAHRPRAGRLVD